MNNFSEKQNTEELLNLLKFQRFKYNQVSIISTINFVLSVIIPIILGFIGLLNIPTNIISYINFIGAVCVLVCLWLLLKIKTMKEKAASIQYLFDIKLFDFIPNTLICNNINEIIALSKNDKIKKQKGLENWYSIGNNLEIKDAIFSCQQQNIRWDSKLRIFYLSSVIVFCLIAIFVILSIGILKNLLFNTLGTYIFLLVPIITYCISFLFTATENIKQQKELKSVFDCYKSKNDISFKDLASLEEKIFHYRKDLIKIPNWFFKIFKQSMQNEADHYAKVESETYSKSKK